MPSSRNSLKRLSLVVSLITPEWLFGNYPSTVIKLTKPCWLVLFTCSSSFKQGWLYLEIRINTILGYEQRRFLTRELMMALSAKTISWKKGNCLLLIFILGSAWASRPHMRTRLYPDTMVCCERFGWAIIVVEIQVWQILQQGPTTTTTTNITT